MRRFPLTVVLLAAAVVAVLALGPGPAESAFPGANGKIVFNSLRQDASDADVYVMNPDGSGVKNLTKNHPPGADGHPAWSADGGRIAFGSNRDGNWEVYVMNADGTNPQRLTNNAAVDGAPAWSPDGSKIAFHSDRDSPFGEIKVEIYVRNADGSGAPTNLTNTPTVNEHYPAWSPDGTKVAYDAFPEGGNWDIYVMNADGSGVPTNLTNDAAYDRRPAWSPDGTKIAFGTDRDGNQEIYVMNADGSGVPTNLTKKPTAQDSRPAWSPDGTKIAFESLRGANWQVYVMNADGSGQTNLSNYPATDEWWADWQPAVGSSSQDVPESPTSVTVDLGSGVTMTCSKVTSAGKATLTTIKGGPSPPGGFEIAPYVLGKSVYYDISTTAGCESPITLCFTYDDTKLPVPEDELKLKKRVGSGWQDLANQTIDTVNNIICGEVDSLSLFVMLMPVGEPVGGMVEVLAGGEAPAAASGLSGGGDYTLPLAAAAAGAVVALTAGAWYARRRLS